MEAKKVKIPREIRREHKFPNLEDFTKTLRHYGIEGFINGLEQYGLTSRQIALFLEVNWDLFEAELVPLLQEGRFPQYKDLLERMGRVASYRKIRFLQAYSSGIDGEVMALKGDEGKPIRQDGERIVLFLNKDPENPISVPLEAKGTIWKYGASVERIASLAKDKG